MVLSCFEGLVCEGLASRPVLHCSPWRQRAIGPRWHEITVTSSVCDRGGDQLLPEPARLLGVVSTFTRRVPRQPPSQRSATIGPSSSASLTALAFFTRHSSGSGP